MERFNQLFGMMMNIERTVREDLGHSFGPEYSVIENATRVGFIYSCLYRGDDCNDKR